MGITTISKSFPLWTINDVAPEREILKGPVHRLINPILQWVTAFKTVCIPVIGPHHPPFDIFFHGSRFCTFYGDPSAGTVVEFVPESPFSRHSHDIRTTDIKGKII